MPKPSPSSPPPTRSRSSPKRVCCPRRSRTAGTRVHEALGLGLPAPDGVRAFASLTSVKEKKLVLVGPSLEAELLRHAVAAALEGYVRELGVTTANSAFYVPPLAPAPEDWSGFPVVVHLVDRGDPSNRTSDIGAMELYAAPVVASDPFAVARSLRSGE